MTTILNNTDQFATTRPTSAALDCDVARRLEMARRRWIRETEQYLNNAASVSWPRANRNVAPMASAA